ncbi:inositol monophosphatase family protein [Lichenihabitans sp. Uapishka_5]|uniref:inositol monophosphatase family protein n=1 Tax=Lichenihabitans sp. Uapishka_5 TaxID=3037302 RepID=UPI0029E81FDA|nr:inositol monophosphatase family protein [Lichenihabitans sp. Uapishka_5]MDX7952759.1 inositol monophosphatase family protein [Lichenihabitans sp. Uapishka_5]
MVPELATRLDLAVSAARQAGAHLRDLYERRGELVIEQKGRNDFVSRADREAEALIKDLVAAHYPGDAFIGEETGAAGLAASAGAIWVVDPLDGTTNFLKGAHNWCVSIGLVLDGVIAAGVIYDPLRDEMFEGAVGDGARVSGRPIAVSTVTDPGEGVIGLGIVPRIGADRFSDDARALLATGMSFRQVGAGALMLAYTAAGRVDAYFERHMWAWDATAGLALIQAAGGAALPYPTGPASLKGGAVLAANPVLLARLEDRLGGLDAPVAGA